MVYTCLTKEEAGDKERELIQVLKSNDSDYGYNIANGGFTGDTVSEETRNKISESRKGLVFTDEHIRNLSISHKNKHPTKEQNYKNMINSPRRKPSGEIKVEIRKPPKEYSKRNNWWYIPVGGGKTGHPAVFPERLAKDHIISWSNIGDVVFDPFLGSGTTAKMAIETGRKFLGCEISEEYCEIIKNRLDCD